MTNEATDFLRNMEGRPVDPGHLEALGKAAARLSETSGISLTDAVVQTIGHEKLNAEQVRRVVEFTNVEAFNRKFAAMSGTTRAVHFDDGPADLTAVLQDLNDGARPREVTIEALEYAFAPEPRITEVVAFEPRVERTRNGVIGEVIGLQSKLAAAHEDIVQSTEASRHQMECALESLSERVKSAGNEGASAAEVYEAWHRVDPEMAKIAFSRLRGLLPAGKVASNRRINPAHPVVGDFAAFANHARKFAAHVEARRLVEAELAKVGSWLQKYGG